MRAVSKRVYNAVKGISHVKRQLPILECMNDPLHWDINLAVSPSWLLSPNFMLPCL